MRRAAAVMRRTPAVLAAVPVALAGLSWHVLVGIVVAVLIVVLAVCWTITDNGRTRRLTTLIKAWRGSLPVCQQPTQSGSKPLSKVISSK